VSAPMQEPCSTCTHKRHQHDDETGECFSVEGPAGKAKPCAEWCCKGSKAPRCGCKKFTKAKTTTNRRTA
jgi:hypothetical protein